MSAIKSKSNVEDTGSKELVVSLSSSKVITYSSILITLGASVYTFISAIPELKKLHDDNIRLETNLTNSKKIIDDMSGLLKEMDNKLNNTIIDLRVLSSKSEKELDK